MWSDDNKVDAVTQVVISIHAPRMGSDVVLPDTFTVVLDISIHAPRMGSDPLPRNPCGSITNFNPRSPDGERPDRPAQ